LGVTHVEHFSLLHEYDPAESGISLDVILRNRDTQQRVAAKLDTGATYCIFQREVGEALGYDIEQGHALTIATQTGSFKTFGHAVTFEMLGMSFESVVYFAAQYGLPRNVLGRYGWLQRVRLALIDYEGNLYLRQYGETE
jgi:hypothetical protein